ncbi:MAG: hypothetical protein EXR91_02705 [Gemmatimonadetes bacterium]|nr:hypothetical protein [Gemmatimonadota bacterium]
MTESLMRSSMRSSLALSPALVLLAALAASPPLQAQESTTRGFNVGAHISGQSLTPQDGDRSNTGGLGIILGYGFNRNFELFLQFDGGQFDVANAAVEGDWTMVHGDLGVRYHFANSLRTWVPYVQAAFTGRDVSVTNGRVHQDTQSEDITLSGTAITLGGGILFYFNETLAADLQLALSGGRFTDIKVGTVTSNNADLDAQSTRFNVGVSWWP